MVNSTTLPRYQEFIEHVKVNHQRMDWQIKSAYSIVKVYEAATTLIGEHPLENGKTMGLAAYGLQDHYEPLFINQIPIDAYFHHDTSRTLPRSAPVVFSDPYLEQAYGVPKENYQIYAEKAKQVQTETQRTVLNLIRRYVEKYKITNVCITGGYGLNVVANSFYKEHLPECNFYFEPLADDSGNSIGAAMSYYRENTKDNKIYTLNDTFYHYYDDNEKIEIVEGLEKIPCSIDDVVNLLSEEKAIGLFQGSPEAGPRALGHRSILFDPRAIDAKDKINQIKNREWYRPFAGMILKEELPNYFEPIFDESPNMTVNFKAKDNCKSVMPGVLHVDNTSRMQTVDSGLLKSLLLKFQDKTGCPSLLNTSMNLAGEPLVQTKKEALHMLLSSNLYGIWFPEENVLVKKLNEQIQP
jgi:carbamoyltransferase